MADCDSNKICSKCCELKDFSLFSSGRGQCKQCRAAYYAEPTRRAIMTEHARKWRAKPESLTKIRALTKKKAESLRVSSKAHYEKNKEALNAKSKAYQTRPERKIANREAQKRWQAKNVGYSHVQNQNRRAAISDDRLSKGLADKLFGLQKGKCPCCKQSLGDNYHLDHVIPLSRGGRNIDSNMQLLRARCNLQKNAKHPIDFMQSRGFLL